MWTYLKSIQKELDMRVLFLTNIPSPYRVDFFNQLGKECDLTVLFERDKASDRDAKWVSNNAKNYKEIFLKGRKLNSDGAISFDVIKWLNVKKFDIFVIGGYSTPTGMLAIQYLKFKKIPFVLNSDGGFIKKDKKMKYLIKKYFISSAKWWLSTGETTTEYLVHYGAKKEDTFVYPFTSIKEEDVITDDLCEKILTDNIIAETRKGGTITPTNTNKRWKRIYEILSENVG